VPRAVRLLVVASILLLGGCVPGVSPGNAPAERLLVFPGGWVEGRWVHQGGIEYSLPAVPVDIDASEDLVGVIYPYSWQTYQEGQLQSDTPLPYPALRLHARPGWVVVLERGLYTTATGWLDYPAVDAILSGDGVFWVNDQGLWQGSRKLRDGNFSRVLQVDDRILALGEGRGVYWPNDDEIELPAGWSEADAASDLYLLTPDGLVRLDPAGYTLGEYAGKFTDLAVADDGDVWLARADGQVVHLTAELEEAW